MRFRLFIPFKIKIMKKVLILMTAFTFSVGAFSQDKMTQKTDKMESKMAMKKDYITMENGKMMVMNSGKVMPMIESMTLKNGTTVMTDGSVKMKDGKTMMMKDGDRMMMNGQMSKMKMKSAKMQSKM